MGVDYTAVLALGKEFTSISQAVRFLKDNGQLQDVSYDDAEDDLDSYVPAGLTYQNLDLYSGGYYYVGIKLNPRDPESFRKDFEDAVELWDKYFPDSPAEMIHTVRNH